MVVGGLCCKGVVVFPHKKIFIVHSSNISEALATSKENSGWVMIVGPY